MKLYIWENNGISSGYHDDGTFIVLADSAEDARRIARAEKEAARVEDERLAPILRDHHAWERAEVMKLGGYSAAMWQTEAGKALIAKRPESGRAFILWDGEDTAIDREPDRVVEINEPRVVAFNGGGYD